MTLFLQFSTAAEPYPIEDDLDLESAIAAEAHVIADNAGSDEIEDPSRETRDSYAQYIINSADAVLREAGDTYQDPTGVTWSLVKEKD